MLKRFTVMAILLALVSLAVAPDTLAHCGRHRRAVAYRSAYYGNSYYRTGYYGRPWSYDYQGPYYGGKQVDYFWRLPYACGVYGYC